MANSAEVLVVGAGPAGIAAAWAASRQGADVLVVDDNPAPGGQIWRGDSAKPTSPASEWMQRLEGSSVRFLCGTRIVGAPKRGVLLAESATECEELRYQKLILACGARELFLPFPGWTLPGVFGAGGLQALSKSGLPVAGKRVVIAGSGPLLLAVARHLHDAGAEVLSIHEQASWSSLIGFGLQLVFHPSKLWEAVRLNWELRQLPFRPGTWPVEARGVDRLESVVISNGRRTHSVECDYLACGFGLVPNLELPNLLGCAIDRGVVSVDRSMQTSVPEVFAVGELLGIGGIETALIEGRIAGFCATGQEREERRWRATRLRARRFGEALESAFSLRRELRSLARSETILCRCEDVTWGEVEPFPSWRKAKLHTRCGMGPCQGRVCGAALTYLKGWRARSIRPPVFPARIETLISEGTTDEPKA